MAAGRYNIVLEHGSTFTLNLTWTDDNGTAVNLSGYSAAMDIRSRAGALVIDVGTDGTIALGGSAGTIAITIPVAIVNAATPGAYEYDLLLTSGAAVGTKLLKGTAVVEAKVTA